jgi:hypothetical protein
MMGWFSAVIERRTLLGWAIVAIVGAIAVATLLALARPSVADHGATDYEDVPAELEQLREATDKYHSVTQALKDGYVAPERCVSRPSGGMGYHYVHQADVLKADDYRVGVGGDPLKPEAMLYEAKKNGELTLVGVEWIVRDEDQVITLGEPVPQLVLGQVEPFLVEPFHNPDGPMFGHEHWAGSPYLGPDGLAGWQPIHFDLHAWIWKHNPDGLFEDWNPDVSCP